MTEKLGSKKTKTSTYSQSINKVDELISILEKENPTFKNKLVENRYLEGQIRNSSCQTDWIIPKHLETMCSDSVASRDASD